MFGILVKEHDCRVREGDTQSMSFAEADKNPPPPFYALDAPWDDKLVLDERNQPMMTKGGKAKVTLGYAGKFVFSCEMCFTNSSPFYLHLPRESKRYKASIVGERSVGGGNEIEVAI